jgi:hypothetical protein
MSTIEATDNLTNIDSCCQRLGQEVIAVLPQRQDSLLLSANIDSEVSKLARTGRFFTHSATCIDRGCGCNTNSVALTNAFAQSVLKHADVPIFAICNDFYAEIFTPLAQRLTMSEFAPRHVTYQMSCDSFIRQLAPPQSVDMVFSNAVVHWLDAGEMRRTIKTEDRSMSSIAALQWSQFLKSVENELKSGGKLVISFIAAKDEWHQTHHSPLILLELAIGEIFHSSPTDASERSNPVPIYLRTEEEIRAPFLTAASRLHLDMCQIESVDCPFAPLLLSRKTEQYATAYTNFIRAFSELALRRWLETSGVVRRVPKGELDAKVADVYNDIRNRILLSPQKWIMQKCRATLVATRL